MKKADDSLIIAHGCQFPDPIMVPGAMGIVASIEIDRDFAVHEAIKGSTVPNFYLHNPFFFSISRVFLHVITERGRQVVRKYLQQCEDLNLANCSSYIVTTGEARTELCRFSDEQKIDLVFVGQRGIGPMNRLLLGSFSQYMLDHAKCSVLLVKKEPIH
jgi:nucleotide-binding universal stress UspA family protein